MHKIDWQNTTKKAEWKPRTREMGNKMHNTASTVDQTSRVFGWVRDACVCDRLVHSMWMATLLSQKQKFHFPTKLTRIVNDLTVALQNNNNNDSDSGDDDDAK